MIVYDKRGGRKVELLLPFKLDGKSIDAVTFGPIRFDHTLRWQQGEWKTSLAFMAAVAGVGEELLRNLAYPDTDRVMAAFVDQLPPEIRDTFGRLVGDRPTLQLAPEPEAMPQRTNGGAPQPPPPYDEDHPQPPFSMDLPPEQQDLSERDALGLGVDLDG